MQEMWETQVWSLGWEDDPGVGNGNPLQYFCLENPSDRGAWWAIAMGVKESDPVEHTCTHTHTLLGESRLPFFSRSSLTLRCSPAVGDMGVDGEYCCNKNPALALTPAPHQNHSILPLPWQRFPPTVESENGREPFSCCLLQLSRSMAPDSGPKELECFRKISFFS